MTMSIGKYYIVTVGRIMKTSKVMCDLMTECVLSNTLLHGDRQCVTILIGVGVGDATVGEVLNQKDSSVC